MATTSKDGSRRETCLILGGGGYETYEKEGTVKESWEIGGQVGCQQPR